mgnify:CR=1 FL=1
MGRDIEVVFAQHAEEQLAERGLDWDQATAVARAPEQVVYQEGRLPVAQSRIMFKR